MQSDYLQVKNSNWGEARGHTVSPPRRRLKIFILALMLSPAVSYAAGKEIGLPPAVDPPPVRTTQAPVAATGTVATPKPAPSPVVTPAPAPAASQAASVAAAPPKTVIKTAAAHQSSYANLYAYGQCTYYVASRRAIPPLWGNANAWYWKARSSGWAVGSSPQVGAVAWTGAGYYGHVALVEQVSGQMVYISEMNFNGNWNRVTKRWVNASTFLYIY